jgi:outer membrane protein assembly factor BamB
MKTKIMILLMFMLIGIIFTSAASAAETGNNTTDTNSTDSSWSQYQQNTNHTGQSDSVGPQTNTTEWFTTGNPNSLTQNSNLAVDNDGTVYYGIRNVNYFYAMYSNGTLKWQIPTSKAIFGVAIGPDGTIYGGSSSGSTPYYLYAFNPNGTIKWIYTFSTSARNIRGLTVVNNTIYTTSDDGTFYAIIDNGNNATQLWNYTTGSRVDAAPAVGSDGTIYFGNYNGDVYALNPNGTLKWKYTVGGQIQSGISISSNGTLYVGSPNGYLYALTDNGNNATQLWNYTTGSITWSTAAISTDGTIYVGSNSGSPNSGVLYALNPDGTLKWNYTIGGTWTMSGGITDSPVIGSDGIIYVGSLDGNIYAINPTDGTVKWKYYIGSTIYNLALSNRTLYVANYGTKPLYAFKDPNAVANFTTNVTNGTVPLNVQFTDTSTGNPTSWAWDFNGDGIIDSTLQNPVWTYSADGIYTVILTVSNNMGNNTITKNNLIKVGNPELVTSDLELPSNPITGTTYTINATVTNTGINNAGQFVVKLYDNNVQVGKIIVNGLNSGANTILNFNWTPNTTGSHILAVIADVNNQINETNRNNSKIMQNVNTTQSPLPELALTNLQLPENPITGTSYNISVKLTNVGAADITSSFIVKLYDNNVQVGKIIVNGLNSGANTILNFNWTPNTTGTHTLSVIADANKEINQTSREYNQITQNINSTTSTLPDLTATNLELPENPIVGNNYTITVTISNIGPTDINSSFAAKLYDNNTQIQKITVNSLAAGASTVITFNWTPTTNGTHNLSAIADANKQLTETIETNNQVTQAVDVS